MEKEKSDQQSMLRWYNGRESPTKQKISSRGLRDQKMHAGTEKRMLIRKLQKERRLKEYDEHEVTMTNIDSMSIARNNEKQMRIETDM